MDVGEEHLIEAGATGHLAQRSDLDAGSAHVHHEAGQASVLGLVGIGAADDLADLGVLGAGGPHLLAVEHPLVAVALGPCLDAGEVAAGPRLAEELAGDDVAPVEVPQVCVAHLGGSVGEDRRGHHPQADGEDPHAGCGVAGLEAVVGPFVGARQATASVLLGAADPTEAVVEPLGPPRLGRGDLGELPGLVLLLEHGDVVVALAPDEIGLDLALRGVGRQECPSLGREVLEGDV